MLQQHSPMSAHVDENAMTRRLQCCGYLLDFGHAALVCMVVSICGLTAYYSGRISAHTELRVEILTLAIKTVFEIYYMRWGTDLLVHHLIMVSAFALLQLPALSPYAFVCVAMQLVHVPLFFKYSWQMAERDVFFKRLSSDVARRFLHSMFWPSWLAVVFFRAPFMLCAAADSLPGTAGWLILGFSACVLYLDMLWTLEVALSKSHGVVGPAVSEPGGWPKGLHTVKLWAVAPCLLGLAAAILPWGSHWRGSDNCGVGFVVVEES